MLNQEAFCDLCGRELDIKESDMSGNTYIDAGRLTLAGVEDVEIDKDVCRYCAQKIEVVLKDEFEWEND